MTAPSWFDSRGRRAITMWVIAFFSTLTLLSELPLVTQPDRGELALYKSLTIFGFVILGFAIFRFPRSAITTPIYMALVICYALVSSTYRPFYVLSVFQFVMIYAFIFPHRPRDFWIFLSINAAAFGGYMVYRWPNVPENRGTLALVDWLNITIQMAAMVIMFYIFFIRARRYRELSEAKFLLLGRQTARITHDLKGLIAIPKLYFGQVEELARRNPDLDKEMQHALERLRGDMGHLQTAITELSRLASPGRLPKTTFMIDECIRSASSILRGSMNSIRLEVAGDFSYTADRSLFVSIVFNLTSNSVAAIRRRTTGEHYIRWTVDASKRQVLVEDSGGGFSNEALSAARDGQGFSNFDGGSGLGLHIVRENLRQMNGTITFENGAAGAKILLTL